MDEGLASVVEEAFDAQEEDICWVTTPLLDSHFTYRGTKVAGGFATQ